MAKPDSIEEQQLQVLEDMLAAVKANTTVLNSILSQLQRTTTPS